MKKILGIALGLVLLVGLAPSAQAQPAIFEASGFLTDTDVGTIWLRYFSTQPGVTDITAGGSDLACRGGFEVEGEQRYCGGNFRAKKQAYRWYADNVLNYGGNNGDEYHAVLDYLDGDTGYYSWADKNVSNIATTDWKTVDCQGLVGQDCLGPFNQDSAAGSDQTDVPGGPIAPIAGLRPIPVPKVVGTTPETGGVESIDLDWDDVNSIGKATPAEYDVHYATDATGDGSCTPGAFTFLKTVSLSEAVVDLATEIPEVDPGSSNCVQFKVAIRYPAAGGTVEMTSRYLSGAGQAVIVDGGATLANIKFTAIYLGNSQVQITVDVEGAKGDETIEVVRGLRAEGPFETVESFTPAPGDGSYPVVDTLDRRAIAASQLRGATGLWYQVNVISGDKVDSLSPQKVEIEGQQRMRGRSIRGRR